MQRSEAQRQASRINGARSKGPITPTGKTVSRFNGLKHGLRAEHVVLPGEDPLAFEAERQAWREDWKPVSHTRAVLVERAAIASWRLRRAVKAEAAFLAERADAAGYAFDLERFNRVERALARADVDGVAAVTLLELDATGLDRLIASCGELAAALEAGPEGWNQPVFHTRLMLLLGRRPDDDPSLAGPVPRASSRLLAANSAEYAARPGLGFCVVVHPLPGPEHGAAAEALRRSVAEQLEGLREQRRMAPEPDDLRRRAVAAAYVDGSEEGKLRHRYEMAIDRSLRATIQQLMMLERSGADLAGGPEEAGSADDSADSCAPEVSADKPVTSTDRVATGSPEPVAPGSLGGDESGSVPTSVPAPMRGSEASSRAAARAGGGGSTR
ncbi:MAG TPA: hypothetical protein VG406_19845 [Isosphaeraceae bacterium]|nr:hypothetical protein [Isosphaeraceae bacterium]